jgi:AraC family transcriptional regulator
MFAEISEVRLAQIDGGPPAVLGAGSAPGESGVFVLNARFQGGMHFSATPRRHHIFFQASEQTRFECRIADRTLSHDPPTGSLAICPTGADYGVDASGSVEALTVAVDPGKLALAAAEDSTLDAQLIERFSGRDQALLDLARRLASESAKGYPNGPLFWNEIASAFIDGLLLRHTASFDGRARGTLGKDVLQRLRDYVMAHLDEPIEVAALAGIAGRSEFHFTRVFTRSVGMSPHRYVVHQRLQRAVELMRDGQSGLAEIAASTGFADQRATCRAGFGAFTAFPPPSSPPEREQFGSRLMSPQSVAQIHPDGTVKRF